MRRIKFWLLSVLSGLLFAFSWPAIGDLTFLIFFAFVPLLYIEHEISQHTMRWRGLSILGYSFLTFFVFNLLTTYWIYFASDWGMAMAVICNSIFMSTVFWVFYYCRKWIGDKQGYLGLIILWIAFEYLHLNWELSWTWLTLGNVFANDVFFVQWYEYTGVLGGSVLVLAINILLLSSLKRQLYTAKGKWMPAILAVVIVLGLGIWSNSRYENYVPEGEEITIAAIQPNIDPYYEKFRGMAESDQIDRMIELSRDQLTAETDLLLWPETAFPHPCWEHEVDYLYGGEEIRKLIADHPDLRVITGLLTSTLILDEKDVKVTSKKFRHGEGWYDNYNTAMELEGERDIEVHHKSKLVLGVEKVPFLRHFPIMKKLSINLGGSSGGYAQDDHPTVFFDLNKEKGVAPIVCYESVYGEYVTQYVRDGAELLAIITNDGWWDDTPGYKQHLAYARLRAIENRRGVGRSANTGISAFINQRGDVIAATEWWVQDSISAKLHWNDQLTFYSRFGDMIGRVVAFLAPLFILLAWVKSRNKTEQRLKF